MVLVGSSSGGRRGGRKEGEREREEEIGKIKTEKVMIRKKEKVKRNKERR